MKNVLVLAFGLAVIGAASATDAQDRYEEWIGFAAESNTTRDLACYSHKHHMDEKGKPFDYQCGSYAMDTIDSFGLVRTPAGDKALAQMWAFALDAGFSESRTCMSLIRGKALLPALRALDPKKARQKCLDSIKADTMSMTEFPEADPNDICLSEASIRGRLDMIIGEIEAGKTCEPWNID